MRHLMLVIVCAALTAGAARAQAPASSTEQLINARFLRDYAETRGFQLGRPIKPSPTPDGKAVLFLCSGPRGSALALYEFDVATAKTRLLLTPDKVLQGAAEKLSPEEKARRERMRVSAGGF